jgi:hypothetical protein
MPYLNSKLSEKHRASCKDPKAKRLYIRDYDIDKRKQIFIPYGITCPTCKVIILDNANEKAKLIGLSEAKPEVVKPKPKIAHKLAISRKELSVYGDVTNCVVCGGLCLATYYATEDGFKPKGVFEGKPVPKQYRGQGLPLYYPDGEEITNDYKSRTYWRTCCDPCYKKHFDQISHNPITDMGRKVVAEDCTFPYPAAVETKTTDTATKVQAKPKSGNKNKKEMSIKELSKYGDPGTCAVCKKNILISAYWDMSSPPGLRPGREYQGEGIARYYPDGKPKYSDAETNLSEWPFVCRKCHKKHFAQHGNKEHIEYGTPLTEEAKKAAFIPYPETK